MRIHTIEEDYSYRIKNILKKIKEDYADHIGETPLDEFLWENKEILGEYLHKDIALFFGDADEAIKPEE